jgi:hypothetical protein
VKRTAQQPVERIEVGIECVSFSLFVRLTGFVLLEDLGLRDWLSGEDEDARSDCFYKYSTWCHEVFSPPIYQYLYRDVLQKLFVWYDTVLKETSRRMKNDDVAASREKTESSISNCLYFKNLFDRYWVPLNPSTGTIIEYMFSKVYHQLHLHSKSMCISLTYCSCKRFQQDARGVFLRLLLAFKEELWSVDRKFHNPKT